MNVMRNSTKWICILVLSCLCTTAQAQGDSILYSFFIAGHTYGAPGVNNVGLHPPFRAKFDYIQSRAEIELGVLTGDIVSANPVAQDWDEVDEDVESLGLPVHFAVGNHDMENRPLYESRYGATYYHFLHENDLFIILDPNIDGWNISGDQLQFLEDVISDNAEMSDNIYVFFHQILWRENDNAFSYISWNSPAGRDDSVNFWTEVEPVFRALSNDVFMFAGDLGASWASDVTYDSYDNITLIASGMGGGDGDNFVVINVHSDKSVTYDLICISDPEEQCLGLLTDYLVVSEVPNSIPSFMQGCCDIAIYPNPASDNITIERAIAAEDSEVEIYNAMGVLVLEEKVITRMYSIGVQGLSEGVYFVRVLDAAGWSTHSLVIGR